MKNIETLIKEAMSSVDSTQGLLEWAISQGGTKQGTTDALHDLFTLSGIPGSLQDQWNEYLRRLGYTGDLSQKLRQFWLAGGTVFAPGTDLFGASEQGIWYDPSDLSTMFTDAGGTNPVTADGDLVHLIHDKSGNNNHAVAISGTQRPTYRTDGTYHWLDFNGTDDGMVVTGLAMTASDKLTLVASLLKENTSTAMLAEMSTNAAANNGSFYFVAGWDGSSQYNMFNRGTVGNVNNIAKMLTGAAPDSAVVTGIGDIAADLSRIRRNLVVGTDAVSDLGTGNYGTHNMYLGHRGPGSLWFNGRLYQFILRGTAMTSAQLRSTEFYCAAKAGVVLDG